MSTRRERQKLAQRRRQARRRGNPPQQDPHIGYFARQGQNIVCDDGACVIGGSRPAMQKILARFGWQDYAIQATTFGEIMAGIRLGGWYCFDEQAYERFLPLGQQAGLPLKAEDFSDPGPLGMHFVRVEVQSL